MTRRFRIAAAIATVASVAACTTAAAPAPAANLPATVQHLPAASLTPPVFNQALVGMISLANGLCLNYPGKSRKGYAGAPVIQSSCRVSRPWGAYYTNDYSIIYIHALYNNNLAIGFDQYGNVLLVRTRDAAHSKMGFTAIIADTRHHKYWFDLAFYPQPAFPFIQWLQVNGRNNQVSAVLQDPPHHLGYFQLPYCDRSCHPLTWQHHPVNQRSVRLAA